MRKAFTLLELLIVIGILAVLATTATVILNPAEILKQSRDVKRIAELETLDRIFKIMEVYVEPSENYLGSTSTVYISLPDASQTCNSWLSLLPTLPTNWSYNCITSDNLRKVNGTGWIPIDFTNVGLNSLLTVLPIDPLNTSDNYYSYTVGHWKFTGNLESQKYQDKVRNSNNISFSLCPAKVKDADFDTNGIEYPIVLINGQCWMAKNLNRGSRIAGSSNATNNGSVEKYCYNDLDVNCDTDGGLYQWNEAMNYSAVEGNQGICSTGWHIPTDSEQYALENYLKDDGQTCNSARNGIWDCSDAGDELKGGAGAEFVIGFNAILTGLRTNVGNFINKGMSATFWSSTENGSLAWYRGLSSGNSTIFRLAIAKDYGFSVRCLKN